jgi:hypothetical protein
LLSLLLLLGQLTRSTVAYYAVSVPAAAMDFSMVERNLFWCDSTVTAGNTVPSVTIFESPGKMDLFHEQAVQEGRESSTSPRTQHFLVLHQETERTRQVLSSTIGSSPLPLLPLWASPLQVALGQELQSRVRWTDWKVCGIPRVTTGAWPLVHAPPVKGKEVNCVLCVLCTHCPVTITGTTTITTTTGLEPGLNLPDKLWKGPGAAILWATPEVCRVRKDEEGGKDAWRRRLRGKWRGTTFPHHTLAE